MFVPETFPIAFLMMVTSMICWGSWANSYKLTKGYRFELFYWDYAVGIFLISILIGFSFLCRPSGPSSLAGCPLRREALGAADRRKALVL